MSLGHIKEKEGEPCCKYMYISHLQTPFRTVLRENGDATWLNAGPDESR